MNGSESDKLVIGLYGEMRLAMELHKRGWQAYEDFHNNFDCLEELIEGDAWK